MHELFNAATWLVDRHVDEGRGDRVAVVTAERTWTYAEVGDEVQRCAAALRAVGVEPEQRVALAALDSMAFVATFLGAMRIGAVPVAMNPLLPGRDLAVITADARARVAVVSAEMADRVPDLTAGAPELRSVILAPADPTTAEPNRADPTTAESIGADPAATGDGTAAHTTWEGFLAGGDGGDDSAYPTWAESPGFWLCTSGSTGRPKLAVHRHGDIPATCETYGAHVLGITGDDRCLSVGPLFHAYGLGNSLTFPFAVGASTVLVPTRPPTPALVGETVTTHRPTLFFCIPTFYAALTNSDLPDDTFASVRLGLSAAEPLPAETFERFRQRFGVEIMDGIGSTEMLHIYLSNRPGEVRAGSSGKPVPGYEVRVIDDDGRDQPAGEPGQLLVSGPSMTTGYWCRTATNQATFEGPWMRTGDLYQVDADGFHTYMGRVDDMLRIGGEWVSPAEVEATLIEHELVLEAAVVGQRDDDGILRPVAYVIPVATDDGSAQTYGGTAQIHSGLVETLTEFCRDKLAGYKRPKRYEIVHDLPKTATGKIQRFKLRADEDGAARSG
jgi:benzoate-CoA ligase family protein